MADRMDVLDSAIVHTFTMRNIEQKKGWINDRGKWCEAHTKCKQPTVVHYECNGIDKWLCRVHYDRLLKKLFGSKHDDA